jgi:uncharacterized membrane protein HdeD (DUF308 family)
MDERREQLRSIAQGAAATVNTKLGDLWWFFMLRGILAAILGISALFWPSRSLAILITLVGVFILADGVTGLIGALRNWAGSENLLQPAVSLVIGPVLLLWPGASVGLLMVVLGVWAWIFGVSQILEARKIPRESEDRASALSLGGIASAIGIILMVWPATGVVAISWLIAIAAFLVASMLFYLAYRTKRLNNRLAAARAKRSASAS